MAIPTILKSTDAGAPVLNGEDGSLYNVMKWALPQLGWTEEFDDAANFTVAFRNNANTGSGTYIEFVDKATEHLANSTHCAVRAYDVLNGIANGNVIIDEPMPGMELHWPKSTGINSNSATAVDWIIIGTDKQFYLLNDISGVTYPATDIYYNFKFAGDINSYNDLTSNFVITGAQANGSVYTASANDICPFPAYVTANNTTTSMQIGGAIVLGRGVNNAINTKAFSTTQKPIYSSASAATIFLRSGVSGYKPKTKQISTSYVNIIEYGNGEIRGVFPGFVYIGNNINQAQMAYQQNNELITWANQILPNNTLCDLGLAVCYNWWPYYNITTGLASYTYIAGFVLDKDWDNLK